MKVEGCYHLAKKLGVSELVSEIWGGQRFLGT
jgi:hypothetical protein